MIKRRRYSVGEDVFVLKWNGFDYDTLSGKIIKVYPWFVPFRYKVKINGRLLFSFIDQFLGGEKVDGETIRVGGSSIRSKSFF